MPANVAVPTVAVVECPADRNSSCLDSVAVNVAGPNPVSVMWSIARSLATVRRPRPSGNATMSHATLAAPLRRLVSDGPLALGDLVPALDGYVAAVAAVQPDGLSRDEALALWINLYNAGALRLAGEAQRRQVDSVLRLPGGYRRPFVTVDGEKLSLDDIEHAKLRRFGDPRIHAALVCGSVSCPMLRREPYAGPSLSRQLDDQLRYFLNAGGCVDDREAGVVYLSRVFLWFGGDFVRPHRMPTVLPVRRRSVLDALKPWLPPVTVRWIEASDPAVAFRPYDWGRSCAVR